MDIRYVGKDRVITDINGEKFLVIKKEPKRFYVQDLQAKNDRFWIDNTFGKENGISIEG